MLQGLASVIGVIGGLITPVLPTAGKTLREWVGVVRDSDVRGAWPTGDGARSATSWPSAITRDAKPLFPRFDDATQKAIIERLLPDERGGGGGSVAVSPSTSTVSVNVSTAPSRLRLRLRSPTAVAAPIHIDEFRPPRSARREDRLGDAPVPKAKKLLHLHIDLGEAKPRTIIAGIAEAVRARATLVGKQVIVVANLPPVTLRGVLSEGMILAAGDGAALGVSAIDRDVPPGTKVS